MFLPLRVCLSVSRISQEIKNIILAFLLNLENKWSILWIRDESWSNFGMIRMHNCRSLHRVGPLWTSVVVLMQPPVFITYFNPGMFASDSPQIRLLLATAHIYRLLYSHVQRYGDSVKHSWGELQPLLPNLNVLVAVSKGVRRVKCCTNKILQFLTEGVGWLVWLAGWLIGWLYACPSVLCCTLYRRIA